MPCNWSTTTATSSLLRRSFATWKTLQLSKTQVTPNILQYRVVACLLGVRIHASGFQQNNLGSPRTHQSHTPLPPTHCPSLYAQCVLSRPATRARPRSTSPRPLLHHNTLYTRSTFQTLRPARHFSAVAVAPTPDDSTPSSPQSLSSTFAYATAHLSDAQVSRVAAQTVRLCIREGEFGDALYVVNSACHSVLRGPLQPEEDAQRPTPQLQPIAFGRPVSPRLAAHAFLHGLVRRGHVQKAQTYARLMIEVGIPIRRKTLENVISTVRAPRSLPRFGPFARVIPRKRVQYTESVLQLHTGSVADACSRAAVELLQTARTFGQQRTERMYRVLVSTLLMQGEIIVASLLFVILVKDWELRKLQESGAAQETQQDEISYAHLGVFRPPPNALLNAPYPDPKVMSDILDNIEAMFARVSDGQPDARLPAYLQSLALFAMLLDTGQMHTHRVASVISALYHCPKTSVEVWIIRDGQPVQINAYAYFHDVLKRLVHTLGEQRPKHPPPPLARRAYNALLNYSLRHRFSPNMASKVLHHMCVKREPPIPPDTVTYNILLRSGTLLRRMHISEVVLAALRTGSQEVKVDSRAFDDLKVRQEPSSPVEPGQDLADATTANDTEDPPPSNLPAALAQLEAEPLVLPEVVASPTAKIKVNSATLTSFVNHLVATGRPHNITSMLFNILPELLIIDHPATNGLVVPRKPKVSRQQALKRAAKHGPHVYAALINAMSKAGEVGLAERIFILAQQAERASQIPGFVEDVPPWRLTVHAYTALMQCYARVAHGRLPGFKRSK
ncbi:hypothetical protein C8Q76DRAFT_399704 [Earliella scabrosa]|nr:hypothetical protein C8Q76DRAFT_399704 [Earliella scabrosa]